MSLSSSAVAVKGKLYQYKLVLLGDSAVGKSSLVLRFVRNSFSEHQESTIGAAFLTQTMQMEEGDAVKLEIWDTAGQERYHSLAPMYYRGAQAAVIVYDITSHDSFERAKNWIKELQRQAAPNIVLALVGNKADLDFKRQVPQAEAEEYVRELGCVWMETSAKTGFHVRDVFEKVAQALPRTENMTAQARLSASHSRINVATNTSNPAAGRCCSSG